jgi:hypothetical protein
MPRTCISCETAKAETDFYGRRSYCKDCDNERRKAHYAEHREEQFHARAAARQAAEEDRLKAMEPEWRARVAAAKKEAAAGARRQKKLLAELGVPDLSPEEITERARRRATQVGSN